MEQNKVRCIIVDDEPVAREILENHLKRIDRIEVVATCRNAMEAFRAVNTHPVELVFLDIQMPDISGLSFARSLNRDLRIIFTTAYRDYAVDGFDLKAVDYLLKPISFERLLQGINKYMEEQLVPFKNAHREALPETDDHIFVRSDRKMVKISFRDMAFVESLGDYVKFHLPNGKVVVTRDTISSIEGRLIPGDFIRVHRSFIVSIAHVETFTSETIGIGKHEIPISRSHREEVVKRLGGESRRGGDSNPRYP